MALEEKRRIFIMFIIKHILNVIVIIHENKILVMRHPEVYTAVKYKGQKVCEQFSSF